MDIPRSFYRIVKTNPPTLEDFLSNQAKGREVHRGIHRGMVRLWDGLSMYASEEQASSKAAQSPMLGSFVAELVIPADGPIRIEQTTRDREHFTLWGDPEG